MLAISQTSGGFWDFLGVCCNEPSYTISNVCNDLPGERSINYFTCGDGPRAPNEFYSKTDVPWHRPTEYCLWGLCRTPFCADGTPVVDNCGIGVLPSCYKLGCTCASCRTHSGTKNFKEMELDWVKKYGMKKKCNRAKKTCVDI